MTRSDVIVFEPYPFKTGQKIRIQSGKRRGDWEVVGLTETKVRLRCPVSGREFDWTRFCYLVEEQRDTQWPQPDDPDQP